MSTSQTGTKILFEDIFEVTDINPETKDEDVFKNVSRIVGKGVTYEMDLVIDIQTEVYKMKIKEKFTMALANTLDMEGQPDDGTFNQSGKPTLLDKFDYGMYGKIFRYEHVGDQKVYGGLLMKLIGEQRHLNSLELDSRIYCLLRKTEKRD